MSPIQPVAPTVGPRSETSTRAEVRQAAKAFEALLLQSLIKKMRSAQLQEGLFGKSAGSSTYEAMFDQHLAETIAESSPLGLADLMEARLLDRPLAELRELQLELERGRTRSLLDGAIETGGIRGPVSDASPENTPNKGASYRISVETIPETEAQDARGKADE